MADKQITVEVPQERVAEFYAWFAEFLSAPTGGLGPSRLGRGGHSGPGGRRAFGPRHRFGGEPSPWSAEDSEPARWIYHKLSGGARQLFDLLIDHPNVRLSGNELARRLALEKGSHGVAGVLAWPGRWCRKLGRTLPIDTSVREDGGTDFWMDADTAELFRAAREAGPPSRA